MGWKTINGRQYYYRSVREGGRVRSEYFGKVEIGGFMAQIDDLDRRERLIEQGEQKEERDNWGEIEDALDDLVADARRAAAEVLTSAGYHQHHRGEWRKRRG